MRNKSGLFGKGRFLPATISGGLVFGLLCLFIPNQLTKLLDGMPWRSAVETTATVRSVAVAHGDQRKVVFGAPANAYHIGYDFTVGDKQLSSQVKISAAALKAAGYDEKLQEFPLYYQPGDPLRHVAFNDPRPQFWEAANRMGMMAGLCVLAALAVMTFTYFYRPNQPESESVPDKLNWPS